MQEYTVDGTLTFAFPDDWRISKYDEWAFYRNQFGKVRNAPTNGVKSIDLLALAPNRTIWLIEVKDYRANRRAKQNAIHEEMRDKVFDTLAALLPAGCNAVNEEQDFAREIMHAETIRVVLHCEQPTTHSKLYPRAINLADQQTKLKSILKSVDPHLRVMDMHSKPASIQWTVS